MSSDTSLRQTSRAFMVMVLMLVFVVTIFLVRYFWDRDSDPAPEASNTLPQADISDIRFLDARILRERQKAGEIIRFIDVRPRESYLASHILESTWQNPTAFEIVSETVGTPMLVIDETIDSQILRRIADQFDKQKLSFGVLRDGILGWQSAGGLVLSQGDPNSYIDQSKVTFITPEKAREVLNSKPFLLDVQNTLEYARGHIETATNIPLAELESRHKEIPFGRPILLYGSNELEGFQAGVRLFDMNYLGSRVMEGGFVRWKELGYPQAEPK